MILRKLVTQSEQPLSIYLYLKQLKLWNIIFRDAKIETDVDSLFLVLIITGFNEGFDQI